MGDQISVDGLSPLVNRAIDQMKMTDADRATLVAFLKWMLGLAPKMDLPSTAPIGAFLAALEALPLDSADAAERTRVNAAFMKLVLGPGKKKQDR